MDRTSHLRLCTSAYLVLSLLVAGCSAAISTVQPSPTTSSKPPLPQHIAASQPTSTPTIRPSPTPTNSPTPSRTPRAELTPTSTPTATPGPSPTPSPTRTLTPTPTIPPLTAYTIDALSARSYGEGDLLVAEELPSNQPFHHYVMEYRSDGMRVTALTYVPFGDGPFPVIVVLHGYIAPEDYYRGLDSALLAETYAQNGYAAIMPDYRGYMGTAGGPNPLRIPYVVDTLNLIASLDTLNVLDGERVGVIGHSMGGGVATYLTVLPSEVDAVVLYGAMSADQAVNWQYINDTWAAYWMGRTGREYGSPETHSELYRQISPISYLDRVAMPVQIHHGDADTIVPVEWSRDLATRLEQAGKPVTYHEYPGAPHTFRGAELTLLRERTLAFFDANVKYTNAGASTVGR